MLFEDELLLGFAFRMIDGELSFADGLDEFFSNKNASPFEDKLSFDTSFDVPNKSENTSVNLVLTVMLFVGSCLVFLAHLK